MTAIIRLPLPPSVNSIWRQGRNPRTKKSVVYLDTKYRAWRNHADAMLMAQKPLPSIQGEFTANIILDSRQRKGDADNRAKAVLDCLQRVGIVANDKFCKRVSIGWGESDGCTVELVAA